MNNGADLSSTQLAWRRFKRHRLAVASGLLLIVIYLIAAFCEFFAPYDPNWRNPRAIFAPPQSVHVVDEKGEFHWPPFVYGYDLKINEETWAREYEANHDQKFPLKFFGSGQSYRFWGLFNADRHLVSVQDGH